MQAISKPTFDPIKGERGEFRISLNLTELGDRAWEILALSQTLGFEQPKFYTCPRFSGVIEVWVVICQQIHSFNADTTHIVDVWDDQINQMQSAIGRDYHLSMIVLCNFVEYMEPVESYA